MWSSSGQQTGFAMNISALVGNPNDKWCTTTFVDRSVCDDIVEKEKTKKKEK
jgi:hypothetical protein